VVTLIRSEGVFGRFGFLLCALVFFLVTTPFSEQTAIAEIRFRILFTLVLLVGVYTMSERRRVITAGVLALLSFLAGTAQMLGYGLVSTQTAYGLSTLFLFYVAFVVLGAVLRERNVSTDTVLGGICVYLLAGIGWTLLYALALAFEPAAMVAAGAPISHEIERGSSLLLYFSCVTLTTLGYGDVTPQGDVARMLAAGEAVFGQLYIAILVARLVGMHVASSSGSGSR
jgi:hypothetical protein